jgi:tetratricopeptide (TPR) repeat protein
MVVRALSNIGALHHDRGDFIAAGKQLREAQAIAAQLDNPSLRGMLLLDLGQIAEKAGRPGEAIQQVRAGIDLCVQAGYRFGQAVGWRDLGAIYMLVGDLEAAGRR